MYHSSYYGATTLSDIAGWIGRPADKAKYVCDCWSYARQTGPA